MQIIISKEFNIEIFDFSKCDIFATGSQIEFSFDGGARVYKSWKYGTRDRAHSALIEAMGSSSKILEI